jgi:predicted AAA+ superfamily ATPase
MRLTKQGYRPRLLDRKIEEYLKLFGAVSVEGPKWCGKTWTTLNHAESVTYLQDVGEGVQIREAVRERPRLALAGEAPHAIDEWQEVPEIWDAVRFEVDQRPEKGRFLLTGSVTPPTAGVRHSGVGRIARVRLRPMTFYESGLSSGRIMLRGMFEQADVEPFLGEMPLEDLIAATCAGGWPAALGLPPDLSLHIPAEYLNSLVASEIRLTGRNPRGPAKIRTLLTSLARNNATVVKIATLCDDVRLETSARKAAKPTVTAKQTTPAGAGTGTWTEAEAGAKTEVDAAAGFGREALTDYLDILRALFVIDEIPGWNPNIRSKARLMSTPKRMFADPSLAAAALGAPPQKLLYDLPTFGLLFEGLCLRDLTVYAEAMDARIYHYRDNSNLEADAIIERRDGAWGAFEIKLSPRQTDVAAKNLLRVKEKMIAGGAEPPACLAVITRAGLCARRSDGVYTVPITCLGP